MIPPKRNHQRQKRPDTTENNQDPPDIQDFSEAKMFLWQLMTNVNRYLNNTLNKLRCV